MDAPQSQTPQRLYQTAYDAWGEDKPSMTPEVFSQLPEARQIGILEAIASLNPGFWAEQVVGIEPTITREVPYPGTTIVFANIPTVRVRTVEGDIRI